MGKLRKVEIDDLMPVNMYEEFLLPRTSSLEELWPALITKALIKLFSYKFEPNYDIETGDASVFYALTGYIGENLGLDEINGKFLLSKFLFKQ